MQHTPGPWKASTRHRSGKDDGEVAVAILPPFGPNGSAKTAVARALLQQTSPGQYDHEQMHANARLIAAAPDLLAALKRAHMVMCVEGENDLDEWNAVLAEVEAAIKATGEEL